MVAVYAELIIKGLKTIDKVPSKIRAEVSQYLIDAGYPELAGGENA